MKVLASNPNLRKLAEKLRVPVYVEIQADVQQRRLTEHERLEQELEDADKEIVLLNYLLRALAKRDGHKYTMSGPSMKCAKRHIARRNLTYKGGGD